ncbi:hypothetical protein CYMTET_28084 [Cymbomonas tetramitiformis]|uniref:Uncharacterized protein n=1 Tax=Cymbomonas tetramitiformis TaxID=36881 RepID=A0AAE0FNP9_9CHLO|nr:hypothetical protein CYMTET_28084 [Cymbomonas tetramitiformis]
MRRLAEKDSTQEGDVAIAGPVDSVYYDSGEMGLEEFVCVENAVVGAPAVVPGGGEWSATTTLSV